MPGSDGGFDWDDDNIDHIAVHQVETFEAEEALLDPRRFSYPSPGRRERRVVSVGSSHEGRLLAVVYTERNRRIRVVTAREANTWEHRRYRRLNPG